MSTIYEEVTEQIIAALENGQSAGDGPGWIGQGSSGMPYNLVSGRQYSGINVLMLWAAGMKHGYASGAWLTYKQAQGLGGSVRKGEKATHIVYFQTLEVKDKVTGDDKSIPMLKGYCVFNADQCDGLPIAKSERVAFDPLQAAEDVLLASGAKIIEGGVKAFFMPSADEIHMPDRDRFTKRETFYSVALHELTHWTGGETRLARSLKNRFGDEAYAMEELIAEIGSAFACADLGLVPETMPDHVSYVASWLRMLKSDKKAIFTAASAASKAHQFIMSKVAAQSAETIAA